MDVGVAGGQAGPENGENPADSAPDGPRLDAQLRRNLLKTEVPPKTQVEEISITGGQGCNLAPELCKQFFVGAGVVNSL